MPSRRVTVGLSVPWDLWQLDAAARRDRLASIADAGIDHLFTADHVSFHDGSGMDAPVVLAALSGIEPRLDLHAGVMLLALRHPMVAARQIATLAEIAPGRVTIGVGVGGEDRHEFEVCGVDPATRGRRTDAALAIVRALLAGDTVDGDGEFFDFGDGVIRPTPSTRIPFLVGGRSDAAVERAGRLGDGWLATWCSPTRFGQGVGLVEARDRVPDGGWQHALQLWVGVGSSPDEGRRHVAAAMERFYKIPFERFEKYTPTGDAEQIAAFLRPYVDAGASTLNLTPCGANPEVEYETIAAVRTVLNT
jgi:alkanesulfonate monooxygenase SsuD/methylene tetrahydromethanopterin reductase-like flavin-dependent oxidoreductase (luciferase family)